MAPRTLPATGDRRRSSREEHRPRRAPRKPSVPLTDGFGILTNPSGGSRRGLEWLAITAVTSAAAALTLLLSPTLEGAPPGCPQGMASVLGRYCIDRYEASLDVVSSKGKRLRNHSPYHSVSPGQLVVARSRQNMVPQAYLSQEEATVACESAGKRLCSDEEWVTACRGKQPTRYPYGDEHIKGRCNDSGESSLLRVFGMLPPDELYTLDKMNDPRLNQLSKTVMKCGANSRCRNSFGVHDMVGNLHEWTANKGGTFRGGYFLDTRINGEGCSYQTSAHNPRYSDYSIGFRCCSAPGALKPPKVLKSPVPEGSPRALDFERKKRARARARAAAEKR